MVRILDELANPLALLVCAVVLSLLLAGCNGQTKVRPFVELEHRRSHELESCLGANISGPRHDVDLYWAPIWRVSGHVSDKFKTDYYTAFGVRWGLK